MKVLNFTLLALVLVNLSSHNIFASEITLVNTSIQSIENAMGVESDYSVFSQDNGRVYWIDGQRLDLVQQLKEAWLLKQQVELEISNDETITNVKLLGMLPDSKVVIPFEKDLDLSTIDLINDDSTYQQTQLNLEEATTFFNALNSRDTSDSQCYKRAHIWAYDMATLKPMNSILAGQTLVDSQKHQELIAKRNGVGVNSMKVFLFYTRKFNRDCGNRQLCKWWFHVAPYTIVDGQEMVFDREFTKAPMPIKDWNGLPDFVGAYERGTGTTNTVCPIIKSYEDYEKNLHTGLCYLRKVPMYYYDPRSVEMADKKRASVRTQFNESDIKFSQRHFLD